MAIMRMKPVWIALLLILILLFAMKNPSKSDYIKHWKEKNVGMEVYTVHTKNFLVFSTYQMGGYDDIMPTTIGIWGKLIDTDRY
ncbi:hypothetical protein [Paenibacillus sp. JDR-2]|uniref:hypothetical protein n=1 Tax=Paenibacillus sp. (strain JDR-2) TaxID=324057 RepID=UPI00059F4745|nr:hypothetical protein [Paenibacillus sp. JDR-2]